MLGLPIGPKDTQVMKVPAPHLGIKDWQDRFLALPHACHYCRGVVWGKGVRGFEYSVYDVDLYYAHRECRVMEALGGKD